VRAAARRAPRVLGGERCHPPGRPPPGRRCDAARESDERTALMLAAECGDTAAAEALIAGGASLEARDYDGSTALAVAAQYGQLPAVRLLLRKGAQVGRCVAAAELRARSGARRGLQSEPRRRVAHACSAARPWRQAPAAGSAARCSKRAALPTAAPLRRRRWTRRTRAAARRCCRPPPAPSPSLWASEARPPRWRRRCWRRAPATRRATASASARCTWPRRRATCG
jgi:hypothetical protein